MRPRDFSLSNIRLLDICTVMAITMKRVIKERRYLVKKVLLLVITLIQEKDVLCLKEISNASIAGVYRIVYRIV